MDSRNNKPGAPRMGVHSRLAAIARQMDRLERQARAFEQRHLEADGIVQDDLQRAWDASIAAWWVLADEAECLSSAMDLPVTAHLDRMQQPPAACVFGA